MNRIEVTRKLIVADLTAAIEKVEVAQSRLRNRSNLHREFARLTREIEDLRLVIENGFYDYSVGLGLES